MSNATLAPWLYDDDRFVQVSASGALSAMKGDWLMYSALWASPGHDATIGSPAYKVSAAGLAITQNPTFDSQGNAITNSAMLALRRGIFRASAAISGTANTVPIGSHAYPDTTGTGVIGQTGNTGLGALWNTAPPQQISANPTGAVASGVAIVVAQPGAGDATAVQLDLALNLTTQGYF